MLVPVGILIVGLVAVILASEWFGLRFGGVVVVPLLAMYMLFDSRALPLFAVSTVVAYGILLVVERRYILYGRRLLLAAIVAGAIAPTVAALVSQLIFEEAFPLREIAFLGSILPGIAAYNLHRLDRRKRIADLVGSIALVVGLTLFGAFLAVSQSLVSEQATFEMVVRYAEQIVRGQSGPVMSAPAPILPRSVIVGLFVLGFGLNEWIQKRYGLRLAGMIAVPMIAVFTLFDARLLVAYVGITLFSGAFIGLIHRRTLLYGRNLLAGTCVVAVTISAATTPLLPETAGIRPLIVGILAGVSAYNGHVLAPTERVDSVVVSTGTFVGMFAVANAIAYALGAPHYTPVGPTGVVIGIALVFAGGVALWEYEQLTPEDSIEVIADERRAVPDGGVDEDPLVRPDGGVTDPLRGRRVKQVDSNASVVHRERGG
jgi:hypothetical protein